MIMKLAAAAWLVWSQTAVGSVVIVSFITGGNTQGFTPGNLPLPNQLDFDSDGHADILFTASEGSGFRGISANGSELYVINAPPPNLGSFSVPVDYGFLIDANPVNPVVWKLEPLGGLIHQSNTIGTIGLWPFGVHYFGLRFDIGGAWHYGWVEIDSWTGINTGYIRSYGWETEANTPIIAGAPEPGRVSLILLAMLLHLRRRRRALGSG